MKINYGKLKNRNIIIGKNNEMRPSQSITKSVIFNSVNFKNKVVLDLFAGTGSLGLEAASLGADEVTWIDNNGLSIRAIKENLVIFDLDENKFKAFKSDFRTALKKVSKKIDVIFLDPPFIAQNYLQESIDIFFSKNILSEKGMIIIECPKNINLEYEDKYILNKSKKIGDKHIIFLESIK